MEWLKRMLGLTNKCILKDDHRFDPQDVCDLKKDPKCVYCGRGLSEICKDNKIHKYV